MNENFPSVIIVADRGRLVAFRSTENEHLERIDSLEIMEGNAKISEIVTDQGGAFPTSTAGTSGYESLPFIAELEVRSFRQIAEKIKEILDSENPLSWGFATPSEINGAILDGLPSDYHRNLTRNLKLDLTNSPPTDIYARFRQNTQS